jgi:hypothetical protein
MRERYDAIKAILRSSLPQQTRRAPADLRRHRAVLRRTTMFAASGTIIFSNEAP